MAPTTRGQAAKSSSPVRQKKSIRNADSKLSLTSFSSDVDLTSVDHSIKHLELVENVIHASDYVDDAEKILNAQVGKINNNNNNDNKYLNLPQNISDSSNIDEFEYEDDIEEDIYNENGLEGTSFQFGIQSRSQSEDGRGRAFPKIPSMAQKRKHSPFLSMTGMENILGLEDVNHFDLLGSDVIRILQSNASRINTAAVGKKLNTLVGKQQNVVSSLIRKYELAKSPDFIKKRDKVAFVLGVTNMWITSLLLGVCPQALPWVYLVKGVVLLLIRLIVYKRKRWHYFMFDMCYFVNGLLMLCILFNKSHPYLWIATFGLANGPVLAAITAWRNSLVFHSLDKVTSLLIHFDPPMTTYVIRNILPGLYENSMREIETTGHSSFISKLIPKHLVSLAETSTSFQNFIFASVAIYSFWQACYWIFVWTMKADNIKKGYATSTTWMLADTKSLIYQLSKNFSEYKRPYVFMGIQFIYTMITLFPAYLMYKYQLFHFFSLSLSVFVATWNGANYYFEVFSKHYVDNLDKLKEQVDIQDFKTESSSTKIE